MTQDYAQSLATSTIARLEGVEKLIPSNELITVTIRKDKRHDVVVSVPTDTGAIRTHTFWFDGDNTVSYKGSDIVNYGISV